MSENKDKCEQRFRVWQLRRDGATQAEIAKELGVSQATISLVCSWLDEALALHLAIDAEEQRSGNPSIDGMERQAEALETAQLRLKPGSKEFLAHSTQIAWTRLKCAELRNAMPGADAAVHSYEFTSRVGLWSAPTIEVAQSCGDDDLHKEFVKAGRIQLLACPHCEHELELQLKPVEQVV